MQVTARCTRTGRWWAVEVLEVDGAYTQARRLGQVPEMAADVVSLLTGAAASGIEVTVEPVIDESITSRIAAAAHHREQAEEQQAQAAAAIRTAARALRDQGLPLRDVGHVLGVSYQRAHQLVRG